MAKAEWRMATAAGVLVTLAIAVGALHAQSPARTLRSFYIGSRAGFGIWSDDIVSVEPVGKDTRIRAMRVVSVSQLARGFESRRRLNVS